MHDCNKCNSCNEYAATVESVLRAWVSRPLSRDATDDSASARVTPSLGATNPGSAYLGAQASSLQTTLRNVAKRNYAGWKPALPGVEIKKPIGLSEV